jgi:hypothetical protein
MLLLNISKANLKNLNNRLKRISRVISRILITKFLWIFSKNIITNPFLLILIVALTWITKTFYAIIILYIRGILNYYFLVNNHKSLSSLIQCLKLFWVRTLALKYKSRQIPKKFKPLKKFKIILVESDSVVFNNWNNKLTKTNLFKQCVVCDFTKHI